MNRIKVNKLKPVIENRKVSALSELLSLKALSAYKACLSPHTFDVLLEENTFLFSKELFKFKQFSFLTFAVGLLLNKTICLEMRERRIIVNFIRRISTSMG